MSASTRAVRVAARQIEAEDICSYELVSLDGSPLPPFSAGAHIDVHVAGLVRQYSLCNDPSESHRYQIAVLKETASRGGSLAMHALQPGAILQISDPKNHFALAHGAAHSLLVAGGIGITPILCMAQRLSNVGASFELHYCTRSPQRTAFVDRIRQSPFAQAVQFHHDDGSASQKLDIPGVLRSQPQGTHLYVCGPTGFMDAVLNAARSAGWTEDRLHREYFSAAITDPSGDAEFEVQIASSGRVVTVPAGRSIVSVLADEGIEVPTSCEQGVCGTCLTRVLEGTPDHRDLYLTPDEQARGDQLTPCCSRAKSARLVLDL